MTVTVTGTVTVAVTVAELTDSSDLALTVAQPLFCLSSISSSSGNRNVSCSSAE